MINIDLKNIGLGHELSNWDNVVLRSGHLYQSLIKENTERKFNYLIMSIDVYNIIETHSYFKNATTDGNKKELDSITYVGDIGEFKCYADIHMPIKSILMKYDKQISRDNKLESILNDSELINEVKFKIDY